jgi:inner membrane protein
MDNLTHSLIGLIAGESIARCTRPAKTALTPETRRGLFVTLAVIGGNLPDLDLLYSYRGFAQTTSAKLDYMLQHRGYTHTLVGCLLLALLLYAVVEGWARWRRLTLTSRDRLALAGMSLFGTFLHLAMDFLNSYGVHPFWPWQNRWFYGDSVFIVEPLYWAAAAPLFFVVRSRAAKGVIALALIGAPVLSLLSHSVTVPWCIGFMALAAVLLLIGARAAPRAAALTSAAMMVLVTAAFVVAARSAAGRIDSLATTSFPTERIVDHVLTPTPMNPLCWDVLLLETDGDRYIARHAVLSDSAALMRASECPRTLEDHPTTAEMRPVAAASSGEIQWLGEFAMSRALLAKLVAGHCDATALMQFARAPFAAELEQQWVVGDLRFDRERGKGMASIELGAPSVRPCEPTVPWIPPREDLLRELR